MDSCGDHTSTDVLRDDKPTRRYKYETGSFVGVRSEEVKGDKKFWIGNIPPTKMNIHGAGKLIDVRWLENAYKSAFLPTKHTPLYNSSKKGLRIRLRKDYILTDTVVVNFRSLTKAGSLPGIVQKGLLRDGYSEASVSAAIFQ